MRHPSLKIFSLLFGVMYTLAFYMEWASFRYYPETRAFYLRAHPGDGPAILWYGWIATAAIVSAAIAFLVPRRLADRVPSEWVSALTLVVVVVILVYEKRWFF